MRVFVYLQDFPPDTDAPQLGIAKAVHGLSRGLAAEGCDVTILCEAPEPRQRQIAPRCDLRCFREPQFHRIFAGPPADLRRYIIEHGEGALFVLNGIFHPGSCAVSRLLRRRGFPYVMVPHDPYHPTIFTKNAWKKWPYWYARERPMLRGAAAVQVLDIRHAQWLLRLKVSTRAFQSTNGFAAEDVLPESSLTWEQRATPSAIFMGRIDAHNKGLDILLTALHRVAPDARPALTIQGPDWGDRDALRSLAKRLRLDVNFPEADFKSTSASIMARHDIVCLPSRFEGFGLAALEAMLSGRVLIVSDIAGISPHVRASGCGVVVDSTPGSVHHGLEELLRQRSHWKQMGLAGRRYALENLRWEAIARDTIKHYQSFLKSATPVDAPARTPVSAI